MDDLITVDITMTTPGGDQLTTRTLQVDRMDIELDGDRFYARLIKTIDEVANHTRSQGRQPHRG